MEVENQIMLAVGLLVAVGLMFPFVYIGYMKSLPLVVGEVVGRVYSDGYQECIVEYNNANYTTIETPCLHNESDIVTIQVLWERVEIKYEEYGVWCDRWWDSGC